MGVGFGGVTNPNLREKIPNTILVYSFC